MADKNTKNRELSVEIKMEDGISASLDSRVLTLKSSKGEVKRKFLDKNINIIYEEGNIRLKASKFNKSNKKVIKSYASHMRNMIKGSSEGHKYTLKICSGHFPMNVTASKEELIVKNFLGEKVPRVLRMKDGADVKIEGEIITVESSSKEVAGQISADIETLTKRTGYDARIFQDGIYITSKDGKEI